jgi:hypothetical protein
MAVWDESEVGKGRVNNAILEDHIDILIVELVQVLDD